jgi:hypothetical protein
MLSVHFEKRKNKNKLTHLWRHKHIKIIYALIDGDEIIDYPDKIVTHIKTNHFQNLGGDSESNYIQHQQYAYHATLSERSSKCCLCFKQRLTILIYSFFFFSNFLEYGQRRCVPRLLWNSLPIGSQVHGNIDFSIKDVESHRDRCQVPLSIVTFI